jgi:hypothetical protein
MKVKRLYMSAVGVIVAGLLAVVMAAPASAAPGLLTPSPRHVNCPTVGVSGSTFCEEVSFANLTATDLQIVAIEVTDREGAISQDFFAQPTGGNGCTEGLTLPPLGNCQLFVFFEPSAAGHRSARLNVFDNLSGGNEARIGLGGRGILD